MEGRHLPHKQNQHNANTDYTQFKLIYMWVSRWLSGKKKKKKSGLIPGLGRSSGEGNGHPLWYFCLRNSMDGGAWWATVHGVAKSWIRLSDFTFTPKAHPQNPEAAYQQESTHTAQTDTGPTHRVQWRPRTPYTLCVCISITEVKNLL